MAIQAPDISRRTQEPADEEEAGECSKQLEEEIHVEKNRRIDNPSLGDRVNSGKNTSTTTDQLKEAVGAARDKGRVVVIAGPTAVGKTRVALALAKRLGGEIVSADSVQVYVGLNIGSAKTPAHEREGVPHHLLDIVLPTEDYTAGCFFDDARAATEDVLARGSVPIVVGGTGMYLRWYMNGKVGAPKATQEVSAVVEAEIAQLVEDGGGWEAAISMLVEAGDPHTAHSLTRNDWYRLRRALEIVKMSGQPRGAFPKPKGGSVDNVDGDVGFDYDFQCYFLYQSRVALYQAIDFRCEQMVAEGLLDEVSWLLDLGVQPNSNSASRAIGYQEAMKFLLECRAAEGISTEEDFLMFLSAFQQASRNLVRRQLTWFRNNSENDVQLFTWIDVTQPLDDIVEGMAKEYLRPAGVPSCRDSGAIHKEASYKDGKILKTYRTSNRIYSNTQACRNIIEWVRHTQGKKASEKALSTTVS